MIFMRLARRRRQCPGPGDGRTPRGCRELCRKGVAGAAQGVGVVGVVSDEAAAGIGQRRRGHEDGGAGEGGPGS